MSNAPIRTAQIDLSDPAAPRATRYDDIYHPPGQALAQAQHVFLAGNGLPERWAGRACFSILETGFGLGNNFLACWRAWREDARRCRRLVFVSVEKHPPSRADLARLRRDPELADQAKTLEQAWPSLTTGWHVLDFEQGKVRLLLGLGDAQALLRGLVAQIDAFFLDGFAPAKNPELWSRELLRGLGRHAAHGASAATWSAARAVREGLRDAGFDTDLAPGFGAKRDMIKARYMPRHMAARPPGRRSCDARSALVVGAGLAGAGVARALARQGLECVVLERRAQPAAEASSLPAGLFHGVVHAGDGAHARWFRAAAQLIARELTPLLKDGGIPGAVGGVLRLEQTLDLAQMQAIIVAQNLPADYVQALGPEQAGRIAGLDCRANAWWFAQGGWAQASALVRAWLSETGIALRCGVEVAAIEPAGDAWCAVDSAGNVLAQADVVVLANSAGALPLAGLTGLPHALHRGQISLLAPMLNIRPPAVPMAGSGYAIPLPGGGLLFGASSRSDDARAEVLVGDHQHNLRQLGQLIAQSIDADPSRLEGRVGWRMSSADRLPLLGPVPQADAAHDQPRRVPRRRGLYLACALGSRGITQAALAGEVIASWISGAPMPVGADLVDAVDVARLPARAVRRAASQLAKAQVQ